jgi:hypothetical protein
LPATEAIHTHFRASGTAPIDASRLQGALVLLGRERTTGPKDLDLVARKA